MQKKTLITILIIILLGVMVTDFKINGSKVFESFFRRLQTESMENLANKGVNIGISIDDQADYEKKGSEIINPNGSEKLNINNTLGSIRIEGEKRDDIKVDYKITVFAEDEKRAEEFGEKLELELNSQKDTLEIMVLKNNLPSHINGIRVDYEIKAPENMFLNLKNKHGIMDVNNFKNGVILNNSFEKMNIKNISGNNIEITTAFNKAQIKDFNGDLSFYGSYSNNEIIDINGAVDIETKYGGSSIKNVGDTVIKADYCDTKIIDPKSTIKADTKYGDLVVKEISENLNVNSSYTDMEIKFRDDFNDYNLYTETEYGKINTSFPLDIIEEGNLQKGEKITGNGSVNINLYNKHADIIIRQ